MALTLVLPWAMAPDAAPGAGLQTTSGAGSGAGRPPPASPSPSPQSGQAAHLRPAAGLACPPSSVRAAPALATAGSCSCCRWRPQADHRLATGGPSPRWGCPHWWWLFASTTCCSPAWRKRRCSAAFIQQGGESKQTPGSASWSPACCSGAAHLAGGPLLVLFAALAGACYGLAFHLSGRPERRHPAALFVQLRPPGPVHHPLASRQMGNGPAG